jgi:hypothetical protein
MDKNKDDKKTTITQVWTREQEQLLAEWSEKASGYRWLHSRCEKNYRYRNYTFTIPVIILSTLTGTANFAMDSFVPEENKQMAMACVGGVNIFAGILSTLQNFLRYAELMEGHRLALVSWSKFGRDIAVELALEPKMRKPAFDFLTICRAEFDRLIEQSPSIDDEVTKKFKKVFKNTIKEGLRVPEICNGLHRVSVYEPSQDERVASIMANVAEKVKPIKRLWGTVNVENVNHISENKHTKWAPEPDKKKDINELKNLGKVSMFKDKINSNSNKTEAENPNIELKEIIVKNEELLNPNIDQEKESLINDDLKHDIEQPKILEEPDTTEPDTEEPDTEEPDTEEPDTEEPDTEELDTEELDTEEPEQLDPDLDKEFKNNEGTDKSTQNGEDSF